MLVRNESHSSTYVDMSSIQVSGFVRRVNFKRVLPPPPKKYPWPSTLFYISLIAFDCKDHRLRIDGLDSYYDDGDRSIFKVCDRGQSSCLGAAPAKVGSAAALQGSTELTLKNCSRSDEKSTAPIGGLKQGYAAIVLRARPRETSKSAEM
jgi:hypothetical protein